MAFKALSSLFGLDDWVGLVFELDLLPVPCFMFQPLGTKQHSLNIQIGEFQASVPQPRAAPFLHFLSPRSS